MVALLAGCSFLSDAGGSPPTGGGAGGSDPDEPIVGVPIDPPDRARPGDGALREEPDPTIVDARGAAVDHYAIGPDGRTVVIYWWGGNQACFGLKEVLVEVQNGTPIISVLEGTRPEAVGRACTMEALLKSAVITLNESILTDGSGIVQEPGEPSLELEPMPVEPQEGIVNARPHPVVGYRLSEDGLQLTAIYTGGTEECYGLAEATLERPDEDGPLVVSIREGTRPDAAVACPDIGVVKSVTFALEEPLIVQAAFDSEGGPDL